MNTIGYWTESGNRYFNEDCLEQEFLLTSEETALISHSIVGRV